jgi:ribosomal protein L37AE/L43A
MEKYGVEEVADNAKTAAAGTKKCPSCGGELRPQEETGVLLCVKCGSQPFETEEPEPNGGPKPR